MKRRALLVTRENKKPGRKVCEADPRFRDPIIYLGTVKAEDTCRTRFAPRRKEPNHHGKAING